MATLRSRCGHYIFVLFMATLWNRAGHYIFVVWFLSFFFLLSFFLHRLISAAADQVYHTSTHGVDLVRI